MDPVARASTAPIFHYQPPPAAQLGQDEAPDRFVRTRTPSVQSSTLSVLPETEAAPSEPVPLTQVQVGEHVVTLQTASTFAPVVTFHPDERYFPCSAEHWLSNAKLVNAAGEAVVRCPTQADLYRYRHEKDYHLVLDPGKSGGEPVQDGEVRAPMYVAAQLAPDRSGIDLTYVFAFAYNGPQTARVVLPLNPYYCVLPNFAEHQGDIEGVTVRVSLDQTKVLSVRFEGHGHGSVQGSEDVCFEGTHPVVRCALYSHATFSGKNKEDDDCYVTTKVGCAVGVEFIDIISSRGARWAPFNRTASGAQANNLLTFVGFDKAREPINQHLWTAFCGHIGAQWRNEFSGVRAVGSKALSPFQRRYANMLARGALVLGMVRKNHREVHGTHGFGTRPWMLPSA